LRAIERATRQTIAPMELPSVEAVNDRRIARFLQTVTDTIAAGEGEPFRELIAQYEREHNVPALDIAAALVHLAQGSRPLKPGRASSAVSADAVTRKTEAPVQQPREEMRPPKPRRPLFDDIGATESKAPPSPDQPPPHHKEKRPRDKEAVPMETFRIEVGHVHGVQPGNIVGAIANEAELDSEYIGRIDVREDHSFVDLPVGMPKKVFKDLKKVWVSGRQLQISRVDPASVKHAPAARPKPGDKKHKPPRR
jgi:ATP-dependent RNA helicase DeaD